MLGVPVLVEGDGRHRELSSLISRTQDLDLLRLRASRRNDQLGIEAVTDVARITPIVESQSKGEFLVHQG